MLIDFENMTIDEFTQLMRKEGYDILLFFSLSSKKQGVAFRSLRTVYDNKRKQKNYLELYYLYKNEAESFDSIIEKVAKHAGHPWYKVKCIVRAMINKQKDL